MKIILYFNWPIYNIYLLNPIYIYIEYNTNNGYKWTPQEVIDLYMLYITVRGPGQYNTNSNIFFVCFDLSFIKFLINTREKQELPGVEPGTSGLLAFGGPTEP